MCKNCGLCACKMSINKALEVLKHHNEWRKGAEIPMGEPRIITQAFETIIDYLSNDIKDKRSDTKQAG